MILRLDGCLPAPHGFLGRPGGVSEGLYKSLNVGLGSGDCRDAVRENRCRAADAILPGGALITLRQVHSARVLVAGEWDDGARPEGDALVTDRPGLLLGVLTADCAPVLFVDAAAGVVGAAHAGWKGALAGVLEATIAGMEALGASRGRIIAAIGPCIASASYEVGLEFQDRFLAADGGAAPFFAQGESGRPRFDLEGYCASRLERAGVQQLSLIGVDTCAVSEHFFSYRRATLEGETDYGRQLSAIALG
ncbi:MAG: peptidoglycan editing factor PgeF [Thermaurantiacus sp.]